MPGLLQQRRRCRCRRCPRWPSRRDRSSCLPAADRVAPSVMSGSLVLGQRIGCDPDQPAIAAHRNARNRDLRPRGRVRPQPRRAAAAMRSSVAVSATRTCSRPARPVERRPAPTRMPRLASRSTVAQPSSAARSPTGRARPRSRRPAGRTPRRAGSSAARRAAYRAFCSTTCSSSARAASTARCTGHGTIIPACLRTSSRRPTRAGSPATNAAAVARQVRLLGQRVDASRPSCEPPVTRGSRIDGVVGGSRDPAARPRRARRSTRRRRRRRRAGAPSDTTFARCSSRAPGRWGCRES